MIAIICLERGMPSRGASSERPDFVPALCTHRPSLLPIEWSGEALGGMDGLCFTNYLAQTWSNLIT